MHWLLIYFLFWSYNFGVYGSKIECDTAGEQATSKSWILNYACVPQPPRNQDHEHKH